MSEASIVLSAVDNTRAAFDSAKGGLQGLHTSATAVIGTLGVLGVAGAALTFVGTIKGAIDAADQINKLSQRTGIAAEQLSQLQFVAKMSDVSAESLTSGIKKLNLSMAEGLSGDKAKIEMFKNLGISLRDASGQAKTADKVLLEMAGSFSTAGDGATKTAYAVGLMGKSGDEMIPLLNGGTKAISDMMDKANKLGLTIGSDFAKQAEEFNDNLMLIETAGKGLALTLAGELVTGLATAMKAMADAAVEGGKLSGIIAGIQTLLTGDDQHKNNVALVEQTNELLFAENALSKSRAKDMQFGDKSVETVANEKRLANVKALLGTTVAYRKELEKIGSAEQAAKPQQTNQLSPINTNPPGTTVSEYQKFNQELEKRLALERSEADFGGKLSESRKFQSEMLAKITGETVKLNTAEKNALRDKVAEVTAEIEANMLRDAEYKQSMEVAQLRQAIRNKEYEDSKAFALAAMDADHARNKVGKETLESIEFETRALTMNVQEREIAVAMRDLERQGIVQGTDAWEKYAAAIAKATGDKSALQQSIDSFKNIWESVDRTAHDVFVNIFKGGQNAFTKLRDVLKATLLDLLYQMTVKKWIFNISTLVTGTASGAANAATGGSGFLGGISNNLSSASSLYSAASGYSQSVSTAASFFGAGQAAGSSAAALGYGNAVGAVGGDALGAMIAGNGAWTGVTAAATALETAAAATAASSAALGTAAAAAEAGIAAGAAASAAGGTAAAAAPLAAMGPVGWAALAVVAVAAIFGGRGKKELTGSGIEGNVGSDGFSGNRFSTWKQSGGWFHNDSSGKETGALDAATTDLFSNSYKAVRSAAMQAATALGLSATVIANYSERISLQLGSDAAANEKAVVALFSNMGDRMASAVAPGLSAMSRQGETAGATLVRLASSLSAANVWLGMLGHTLLEVSLAGGNAASKLADAFGGIENMATASKSFYETYYAQAERSARSIEDMTKVLGALGLSLPASKDAFRAMATGLDLTTDAGRKAYAAMLTLAPEFAATTDALGALSKQAAQAIEALFSKLSQGIRSAIERIAGERFAVAEGVQQINGLGTMSRDAILRGIAGTSLAAPGIGGLSAAQSALGQADAAVAAQVAAVAYAKTQTPSRAALDGAGGALGAAQNATRAAQSEVDRYRAYGNSNFNMFMDVAEAGRDVRGSGVNGNSAPWGSGESNAQTVVFALQAAQRNQQPVQAAYDAQLAAYSGAAALNASQVAAAQAKLSAATVEQVASVTAAKAAQQAYIASLQDFAIDATKSAAKLGTLREETLKYYDAQKQLADLMVSSAAGLRAAVTTARNEQLDSAQNLAQQQSGFSSAYSMALATTGVAQTGYADKLTAALPGLSTALMDAASTREEWALATGTLFAQSEAIAKQLQANAPQNYAADSLLMLGQIDAALTVLDASSKSAEKIIADAVTAGSENTANGLRAVIAALTGKSVPAFALGGSFVGGLRIVGENGPELEATGPSRIFSASQTRSMLSGGGSTARLEALVERQGQQLEAMSFELRAIAGSTNKTARSLDRAMPDGDALATRATV